MGHKQTIFAFYIRKRRSIYFTPFVMREALDAGADNKKKGGG